MEQKLQSLFFFFLLGAIGTKAQIPIITAVGVNPVIGDSITIIHSGIYDNVVVKPPISNGQNLVWDYTYLNGKSYSYGRKINPSNGLLYSEATGNYFPQNLPNGNAVTYDSYNSEFFINLDNITNSSWDYGGAYESFPTSPNFVYKDSLLKPMPYVVYPMTYGTLYADSTVSIESNYSFSNSTLYFDTAHIYDSVNCSAFGTLKLPTATYNNVLLIKHTMQRANSKNYFANTPVEYLFMVNGIHGPVLKIFEWYSGAWAAYYISGTSLPIEISSFTASWQNKLPYLKWSAANIDNTKAFNIQRSVDGRSFFTVGKVGVSGGSSYHFEDSYVPTSIVYYRLQQLDKDGQTFYSNTAQLTVSDKQFSISPNPAKDFATISFSKTIDKATIAVYDITGKAVITQSLSGSANSYKLNTQTLTNGVYVIKVNTATGSYNEKLLINK